MAKLSSGPIFSRGDLFALIDHGRKPWLWHAPQAGRSLGHPTLALGFGVGVGIAVESNQKYPVDLRFRCRSQQIMFRFQNTPHRRHAGTAEPFRVARPEAVGLFRTKGTSTRQTRFTTID
jgi:hypothetical protein